MKTREAGPKLDPRHDWLGPPNAESRIRPIRLKQVTSETETERDYRIQREKLNQWNSEFWAKHNHLFEESKAGFMEKFKEKHGILQRATPEEMSEFYRSFLDTRKDALAQYNRDWYRQNVLLIWPAIKVNFIRVCRLFRR